MGQSADPFFMPLRPRKTGMSLCQHVTRTARESRISCHRQARRKITPYFAGAECFNAKGIPNSIGIEQDYLFAGKSGIVDFYKEDFEKRRGMDAPTSRRPSTAPSSPSRPKKPKGWKNTGNKTASSKKASIARTFSQKKSVSLCLETGSLHGSIRKDKENNNEHS